MLPAASSLRGGGSLAVSLLVGLADGRGDAAAVRDLVARLARPSADACGIAGGARSGAGAARATTAHPTSLLRPAADRFTDLLRVLGRQVDLVGDSVQGEVHRLIGLFAVQIVDELDYGLPCHRGSPSLVWCQIHERARASSLRAPSMG